MSKTYKIKVNSGQGEAKFVDIPQVGNTGKPLTVKAVAGGKYQLVDASTGFAPENIRANRVGKNLQVFFEGRNTADLVVEDYYDVTAEGFNALIGEAESGRFYEYIPESAAGNTAVPALADGSRQIGMALGGAEINPSGAAVGALVAAAGLFNPLWLGVGALGAAAAAGGGGSDSGNGGNGGNGGPDTTPPTIKSGKLHADDDTGPKDNITQHNTPRIQVETEPLADVEIVVNGKTYTGKADDKGMAVIEVTEALKDGPYTPKITATDAAKNKSVVFDGTPFTVDNNGSETNPNLKAVIDIAKIDVDSGSVNNDFYTNDNQLLFSGTVKSFTQNGDWIKLELKNANNEIVATTHLKPTAPQSPSTDWTWSWDRNSNDKLPDGNYTLTASVVDGADNVIGSTNALVTDSQKISIDTDIENNFENGKDVDPNKSYTIDIVSMKLDTGHNLDGNNATLANGDFITKAREHQYSGTLTGFTNNGASVELILTNKTDGSVIEKTNIQPTLDSNNQKWSWTWNRPGSLLADGEYNLVANLVDKAGNLISKDTQVIKVDNSQDNNSGIKDPNTDLKLNPISILDDTGVNSTDFLTNDQTLTFKGSFDKAFINNGDRLLVKIFDVNGKTITEKFVLPDGTDWNFSNTVDLGKDKESHNYTIKASLIDAAGNIIKATDQTFVVDNKPADITFPKGVASGTDTDRFDLFQFSSNEQGKYTYTTGNTTQPTITKNYIGGFLLMPEIANKTFDVDKFQITFTDNAGNISTIKNSKTWIFGNFSTETPPSVLAEPGFEKDQLVGSVGTQTITSADFNMASLYDGIATIADVAAANHIQLGAGKQTLALTMGDVLELGVKNSFNNTGDHKGRLQLRIDGDAQDVIKLDNLAGSKELAWNTNNVDITLDGQAYKVFSNADLGLSLFVSNSITTINLV